MPWKETTSMDERVKFMRDYAEGLYRFSELCAHYSISRKTGYKWLARYQTKGEAGLQDQSRAPKGCPHQVKGVVAEKLIAFRKRHPHWGPKKIVAVLAEREARVAWPAPSTVGALLKRAGLVEPRRRRPQPGHPGLGETAMDAPNRVWTADFKGEFKTRDGAYCYPLTVVDGYSRYLLACQALSSTEHVGVVPVFEGLFREHGLPEVIRTDNGVPFASQAIVRLSRLQVWWIKLGIMPELIEPAHPEQNGRHERLHRTLKAEATRPPAASARGQQRVFDRFRTEYNAERPHEALGQVAPAKVYHASPRRVPGRLAQIVYPAHYEVRLVSRNGGMRWNKAWVNVSHVLAEEYVGLEEVNDGVWSVYFGPVLLGRMDEKVGRIAGTRDYYKPE